ncbi:hypothetical protein [Solidesulfovibrio sp.]
MVDLHSIWAIVIGPGAQGLLNIANTTYSAYSIVNSNRNKAQDVILANQIINLHRKLDDLMLYIKNESAKIHIYANTFSSQYFYLSRISESKNNQCFIKLFDETTSAAEKLTTTETFSRNTTTRNDADIIDNLRFSVAMALKKSQPMQRTQVKCIEATDFLYKPKDFAASTKNTTDRNVTNELRARFSSLTMELQKNRPSQSLQDELTKAFDFFNASIQYSPIILHDTNNQMRYIGGIQRHCATNLFYNGKPIDIANKQNTNENCTNITCSKEKPSLFFIPREPFKDYDDKYTHQVGRKITIPTDSTEGEILRQENKELTISNKTEKSLIRLSPKPRSLSSWRKILKRTKTHNK